jgi:hypothetical protein
MIDPAGIVAAHFLPGSPTSLPHAASSQNWQREDFSDGGWLDAHLHELCL